jgi:hypothetical protein
MIYVSTQRIVSLFVCMKVGGLEGIPRLQLRLSLGHGLGGTMPKEAKTWLRSEV